MRESVSAIFVNGDDEIFMIKRQDYLRAFPGHTAFPGGKIDEADRSMEKKMLHGLCHPLIEAFSGHLIIGLQRELLEELGFDLFKELGNGNVEKMNHLGVATTPDFNPYRFENHYFKIHLKSDYVLNISDNRAKEEMASWGFISPRELLGQFNQAEILAVPPTIKVISALQDDIDLAMPLNYELDYNSKYEVPMIESIKGVRQFMPKSHTFPPASRTNCFLIGDDFKVAIDPSPKDEEEYKKLNFGLSKIGLDKIFLTHHHPDHVEFSTKFAREHSVPMGMSKDTHQRLLEKNGSSWFLGIEIELHQERDVLTKSLGSEVLIFQTPGHDEGQLSLAPKSLNWCIAGDLIQTTGTVVIGGDEGNMRKYFSSLEKMIKLDARVIFPSHGIAMGGVYKLEETLSHRKKRESQIIKLLKEEKSRQDIFKTIYGQHLDEQFHQLAFSTIDAHIEKIEKDKAE